MPAVDIEKVECRGDQLRVTGTVDGVAATATAWRSHVDTLSTVAQKRRHLAERLRDACDVPVVLPLTGSVNL
ncbi:MAG TPA: hypothetical protein VD926_04030 [Acidimicrobiales bacterium]|nr:hypothetical protein [Acidimicrobiales bacterium]